MGLIALVVLLALDDFLLLLLRLVVFGRFSSLVPDAETKNSLKVSGDMSCGSLILVIKGDLHGLVRGVQSASLSSKTTGKRSSSEMKLVAAASVATPPSDERRGHDGNAQDGSLELCALEGASEME